MKNNIIFSLILLLFLLIVLFLLFFFEKILSVPVKMSIYCLIAFIFIFIIIYYLIKMVKLKKYLAESEIEKKKLNEISFKFYHECLNVFKNQLHISVEPLVEGDLNNLIIKINQMISMLNSFNYEGKEIENTDNVFNHLMSTNLLKQKYFTDIIINFIKSVIKNILTVSKPISDSLFLIKSRINEFFANINSWKNEFNDKKSKKNFTNIISKYEQQNKEFENIVTLINKNYHHMEKNFDIIIHMIDNIVKNTGTIDEISEKIRILSINASIEAARAGECGKGFKIVSEEVKKLSNETQISNKNILLLIGETRKIVNQSVKEFNNELMNIINLINKEKDEYQIFYEILKNYYDDLNNLFSNVTEMINNIKDHINRLIPVFQISNLSVQEMENLIKMINKFVAISLKESGIVITETADLKKNIFEQLLMNIKTDITTESEITILNQMVESYQLDLKKIEKKSDKHIEIF